MDKKEMIELMVQERLSLYFKKNGKPGKERMKRSDEFLALLEEKAPELAEEFMLIWTGLHPMEGMSRKGSICMACMMVYG